jgi:threonine dehydrogenase-like Zn-dependent dehydrogenase
VKVYAVGLDGTDKEINEGLYGEPPKGEMILVLGHESLGEVVAVGKNVRQLQLGDLVVATVRRPDDCQNCQVEEYDMCLRGEYTERGIKGQHGFLSEFYVENSRFLVKVPQELKDIGILLEPTSVAEKAIRMAYSVQQRLTWTPQTAMVTGSGTLGLLTALLLRKRGLDVISVDRSDDEYKRGIFSKVGIHHYNITKINLHDIPHSVGKPIDIIVEATGNSSIALHAMSVVGTNGVVVLTSITGGGSQIQLCADCLNQGLVLGNKAVVGSVNAHRKDFEQGVDDLLAVLKEWPDILQKLITARYPPEQFTEAFASMHKNIKVIIEFI